MLTKLGRSIAWVSGLKLEMGIEHLQKRGRKFDIPRKVSQINYLISIEI